MQCRIEDRGQDSRIVRFIRASFNNGNRERGMRLMQTCSNNTTRLTAANNNEVEVLLRGHHDGRDAGMYCKI